MAGFFGRGSSAKPSKYAVFPFQETSYWRKVEGCVGKVDNWSPLVLAETLYLIKQLQRDTPSKSTPDKKYERLLLFFEKCEEFSGDEELLWGGVQFKGVDENFPKVVWWFMRYTLPHITKLLLELPTLFEDKLPLVDGINSSYLSLTKHQCASLLAMAFFSANDIKCQPLPVDKYQGLVTFDTWIQTPSYSSKAKLLMLMNYFERSRVVIKEGNFEIHRLRQAKPPSLANWVKDDSPLTKFTVCNEGGITETCGEDVLHVDFANQYIGGGVMHMGAVQEEIMFSVCPELLVSLMFCSAMDDNEALVLVNADKIAQHTGYSTGLGFVGDHVDTAPGTCRVAIDATCYGWGTGSEQQWTQQKLLRELNKAYVGFNNEFPLKGAEIATGNWGCGAFGGNIQLKAMLQWCAAGAAGRGLQYFTFEDWNCKGMDSIVALVSEQSLTVGSLMQIILDYCEIKISGINEKLKRLNFTELPSLFDFIAKSL